VTGHETWRRQGWPAGWTRPRGRGSGAGTSPNTVHNRHPGCPVCVGRALIGRQPHKISPFRRRCAIDCVIRRQKAQDRGFLAKLCHWRASFAGWLVGWLAGWLVGWLAGYRGLAWWGRFPFIGRGLTGCHTDIRRHGATCAYQKRFCGVGGRRRDPRRGGRRGSRVAGQRRCALPRRACGGRPEFGSRFGQLGVGSAIQRFSD
jgi:hypothetical protein